MVESCEKKLAGICSISRPRKSFNCDIAITMAMPLVKPITIATGTKRTIWPSLKIPIAASRMPAIIVESSIRIGYAILIGASLGFLGLGVQPPTPDWGLMIFEGRSMIQSAPWMVLGPAVAISTLVIAANLFADGLSRVLDSSERMEELA